MRPTPARLLLAALVISALTAAALTSQLIFYLVALMAGFLLATSLSTTLIPLTRALNRFRGCAVEVRVWGAMPPLPPGTTLVLTSVNVLGPGFHVFFQASGGGSIHLKVAQPTNAQIAPNAVVVGSARYVQWGGKKLPAIGGMPAVSVSLSNAAVKNLAPPLPETT
jgi:hypothetical protein